MESKSKILFVNPPYNAELYFGKLANLRYVLPPMGILSLGAYLREKGHDVRVYDFEVFKKDFIDTLMDFKPDVVGITCPTILVESTIKLSELIKKHSPDSKVIVGGAHPTARPEDLLKSKFIDFAVRGEGELITEQLINALLESGSFEDIKGISYLKDNEVINNPPMALMENLDDLPVPAVDLVPIDNYRPSPDLMVGSRSAAIFTSRGCPYTCIFCANNISFNYRYRERPLNKVFDEIEYYIERYDIDSLMIMDDTFCINKARVKEFCNMMIQHGYNKRISWWAQTRADKIDKELALLMKEAGCRILSLGLESGVQKLLDVAKKNISLEKVPNVVKTIKKTGLVVRASFIFGLPTETVWDSLKTIWFALSLPLDFCKFSLATPYPGTELWNIAVAEGRINTIGSWNLFTQMAGFTSNASLYVPHGRSALSLKIMQRIANSIYYVKPNVLIGMYRRFSKMNQRKEFFSTIWTGMKAVITPSKR